MQPRGKPNPTPVAWTDPARERTFDAWLAAAAVRHGVDANSLRAASSDASFRRYFRVDRFPGGGRTATDSPGEPGHRSTSLIVMDAPPPQEDVRPFVRVAGLFVAAGLQVPQVLEADAANGFLLLTDLGTRLYLDALRDAVAQRDAARRDALIADATRALIRLQTHADASALPLYDDALLRRELALFPAWCVERECGVVWSEAEQTVWRDACDALVASALAQPTVAVHRDYMARNLMVTDDANPAILDFQDAVRGPPTYDIACLLRDAYLSWDEEQEIDWAVRYWQHARPVGVPLPDDFGEFWRQLEWMGLQRHLKVLGIFCRLKHRDGKPAYSHDLPRFFDYAHKVASRYNLLRPLGRLLEPLMGAQRLEGFY